MSKDTKQVLVIGGAGYIGSQTVWELLDEGYEPVVVDFETNPKKITIPSSVKLINWDLTNQNLKSLADQLSGYRFSTVIHFAAYLAAGESMQEPWKYYHNNILTSLNIIKLMQDYLKVDNLIFSSTAAVYGNEPEKFPIPESDKKNPVSVYGRSKLMVETILEDIAMAKGLKSIRVRYFNACGADIESRAGELHDPETHLIPIILQTLSGRRKDFKIFGNDYQTKDGTCLRDYIHVKDLARGHIAAMQKLLEEESGYTDSYNLAAQKGYTILEIIQEIESITGLKVDFEYAPRRLGDPDKLVACNTKALIELDWQPEYSDLSTIIESAWNWEKKQAGID